MVLNHCIVVLYDRVTDDASAGHGCDTVLFQVSIQVEACPLVENLYIGIAILLFLIVERSVRVTRDFVVQVAYNCTIREGLLFLLGDAVFLCKLCQTRAELQCVIHRDCAFAVASKAKHGLERAAHTIGKHIRRIGLGVDAYDVGTVPGTLAEELVLVTLVGNPQDERVHVGVNLLAYCYELSAEVVRLLNCLHAVHPLVPGSTREEVLTEGHLPLVHVGTLLATCGLDVETSRDVKDVGVLAGLEPFLDANLLIPCLVEYRGDIVAPMYINLGSCELNSCRKYCSHNTHDATSK